MPKVSSSTGVSTDNAVKVSKVYDNGNEEEGGFWHAELTIIQMNKKDKSKYELSAPFLKNGEEIYRHAIMGVTEMFNGKNNNEVAAVLTRQSFVGGEVVFLVDENDEFTNMLDFIKKFCSDKEMRPEYVKLDMPAPISEESKKETMERWIAGQSFECVLCKQKCTGFSNNADPLANGRCCDGCNPLVIRQRFLSFKP
jgi:hypothetical protein